MEKIILILAVFFNLQTANAIEIDRSVKVFFPASMAEDFELFQKFPISQWNFLLIPQNQIEVSSLNQFCENFKNDTSLWVKSVHCRPSLNEHLPFLKAFAKDIPLRISPPKISEIENKFRKTMVKLSLPLPPELVSIYRSDPMGSHEEWLDLLTQRNPMKAQLRDGFFELAEEKYWVLPFQMIFPASDQKKFHEFRGWLASQCTDFGFCDGQVGIGIHFGSEYNQGVIESDLGRVSIIGGLGFFIFLGLLLLSGRGFVISFTFVVGAAVVSAAYLTNMYFGQLHGLTLAFGSGVIGLSLDYGFHGLLGSANREHWWSNFIGLLTTLIVLIIVGFSKIPLLQQMMFFSVTGLIIAFLLFLIFYMIFKNRRIKGFPIQFRPLLVSPLFLLIILVGVGYGLTTINPSLSLSQMDSQSPQAKKLSQALLAGRTEEPPLISLHGATSSEIDREWAFIKEHSINVSHVRQWIPGVEQQLKNLQLWRELRCGKNWKISSDFAKIYSPFVRQLRCRNLQERKPIIEADYLAPLVHEGQFLSLWYPRDSVERELIQKNFPEAQSLRDLVGSFPHILQKELRWMWPLSFFLILLILLLYYRKIYLVISVFIPFVTGLAAVLAAAALFSWELSFVSLVGLLMVYGLSIDYGVFVTDAFYYDKQDNLVWTAIILAGMTSTIGFLPLAFCAHPVLFQLGSTIVTGVIGTLFGSLLILPWWLQRKAGAFDRY